MLLPAAVEGGGLGFELIILTLTNALSVGKPVKGKA